MNTPKAEVLDRLSILILKFINGIDGARAELSFYAKEAGVGEDLLDLLRINSEIWQLEADIRKGVDLALPLEEIGRRAIAIRNKNRVRIEIKNRIASEAGECFFEIKKDHISD